jgi:YHS domain-containing protein
MMKMNRTWFALTLVLLLVFAVAALADEKSEEAAQDKVIAVQSNNVCMVNDRAMAMEQIPVEIDGKTYYGCGPMCKERLVKDEASRFAIDPVSGRKVDKAKAVIGVLPGAVVLYFENQASFQQYNAGKRAKKE